MKIPIIILAAGASSRLGKPKQLLPFQNSTLLELTVNAVLAAEVGPVYVVTGASHDLVVQKMKVMPVSIVENQDYIEGIASSIKAGLDKVLTHLPNTHAVILCLCDQPYITSAIIRHLVANYEMLGLPLVHCQYNKVLTGPPALIDRKYFSYLLQLQGDAGAKKLFLQYPDDVSVVDFPRGETDIDTWLDYQSIL